MEGQEHRTMAEQRAMMEQAEQGAMAEQALARPPLAWQA